MSAPVPASPRLILGVLCVCSFSVTFNNYILSPLLVDVSRDLGVSLARAALLPAAFAVPAAILALVIAPLSDKYGRRPILVAGVFLLFSSDLLSAAAWDFQALAFFRFLGGIGLAAVSPTMFAALGDAFPYHQRGRAIGTLLAANTMSTVVGVPMAAILGGLFHWRVAFVFIAATLLVPLLVLWSRYPRVAAAGGAPLGQYFREYRRILAVPSVVSLHACITLNAVGWVAWMTFVGAFFIQRYGMATEQLSIVNAALGLGGVVGSALGGRIADRWLGHRRLVIWTAFVTGPLIVAQTNLIAFLPLALVVNPFLSAPMGARFAGMITLLSEQNPEARGRLLSLNTNGFQTGVVIGAAVGGMVLESWGYGTLGLMAGGLMMLSSLPVAIWAREGPRARTLET